MNLFEFQVKKSAAPEFKKKSFPFEEKGIKVFKDGERFICYVLSEENIMGKTYYNVEDVDGTIQLTINNEQFHKITDPKQFSKRFIALKQKLRIVDTV